MNSALRRGAVTPLVLADRITDRDHQIATSVYEHRVLTVTQLAELHFHGLERARKRLTTLTGLRVLARFRPPCPAGGSSPYHYVLDEHGALLIAARRLIRVSDLDWPSSRTLAVQGSQQLRHRVDANGFTTRLAHTLRTTQPAARLDWTGQAACARTLRDLVQPDSHLTITWPHGHALDAFLEWDRGTETLRRLQDKLDRYDDLAIGRDQLVTVLLVLPSERRERNAHHALTPTTDVRLLTTTAERHHADPLARNWLPASHTERVSLTDLPQQSSAAHRAVDEFDPPGSPAGPKHPDTTNHHTDWP
jgi:hypothetical protein